MNTEQSAYWHTVQETMVTFHGLSRETATNRIQQFRLALVETGDPLVLEFATHEEAFYLAARLAGRKVTEPTPTQAKVYAQIMKHCTDEAVAFGPFTGIASKFHETRERILEIQNRTAKALRRKKPTTATSQKLAVAA